MKGIAVTYFPRLKKLDLYGGTAVTGDIRNIGGHHFSALEILDLIMLLSSFLTASLMLSQSTFSCNEFKRVSQSLPDGT
eukprot:scaffold6045_cov77-Skeletonema_marinoi.AAC.2